LVKEFLDEHGYPYRSVDVGHATAHWQAAGSPVLPALVVGGVAHPLSHPVQVASLLGLEGESLGDPVRIGWDLHRVLEAWLEALELVPWPAVLEETPSRGRSTLELAVNTFVPVGLLPDAFATLRFAWPGNPVTGERGDAPLREYELPIEATITDAARFTAFSEPLLHAWAAFLDEHEHDLRASAGREVQTPAGALPYVGLLDAQRLHAAQHFRQMTTFFRATARPVPPFDPTALGGLRLPQRIY
jgi:hypothetical protein